MWMKRVMIFNTKSPSFIWLCFLLVTLLYYWGSRHPLHEQNQLGSSPHLVLLAPKPVLQQGGLLLGVAWVHSGSHF